MPITRQESLIKLVEISPKDFFAQIKNFLDSNNINVNKIHKNRIKTKALITTDIGTIEMKGTSLRYMCFMQTAKCTCCGIEGNIVFIEKFPNDKYPHANLYHRRKDGSLMLMTKDHIIPKSKGGRNHINNLQTMCSACNETKGNRIP